MRGGLRTLVVIAAAWLASTAVSQAQDDEPVASVRRALADHGFEGLSVRVSDGVVILSGSVESAREKILAVQAAFTVPDVEAVDTELRLRVGVTPDVEEAIWLDLMQEGVDAGVEEVVVENGVASVSGRVPDAGTRERVLAIARHADGVEAVTSAIVVADAAEADEPPEPETSTPPEPPPEPEAEPPPPEPANRALDVPRPPARGNLARDIAERIVSHPDYTVFDHVQFSLDGADVVLLGSVTSDAKKASFETTVASVSGVGAVTNELHVLSSDSEDRRLRERLFRRIYEDPSFVAYADSPNPPIHIIVEARLVTLTGVVDAQILQMSAEAIVRTTFGVRGVRNQIRVRQ